MIRSAAFFTIIVAVLFMSACGGEAVTPTSTVVPSPSTVASQPTSSPTAGDIIVESVDVQILESFPVQVTALARGTLPDACSSIASAAQARSGNSFNVTLTMNRPADATCAPSPTSFEHTIPLDVAGLPAGDYTVTVNGVSSGFTLSADNQPIATVTTAPVITVTAGACTNKAAYVADVTIPDNTRVEAGGSFTKTWRIRNDGTCTWGPDYALVFDRGAQIGGQAIVPLSGSVAPGSTTEISVNLQAPPTAGTHRGDWRIRAPDGTTFGVGAGDSALYVQIVVESTSQPPAGPERIRFAAGATSASVSTNLSSGTTKRYILGVQAGQRLIISTTGNPTVVVTEPGGSELTPAATGPNYREYSIERTGDYTIALRGSGAVTLTITIPPLEDDGPITPPANRQRISFAPGATSASVEMSLAAGEQQGFVVGAAVNQRMTVLLTNPVETLYVLDPNNRLLPPTTSGESSGRWVYDLPRSGDYIVVVQGGGDNSMTIEIPPP